MERQWNPSREGKGNHGFNGYLVGARGHAHRHASYYTLRYLLAALLADGVSLVRNPARSDDTVVLVQALRALGAGVSETEQ